MCVTRVGKVLSRNGNIAMVMLFDQKSVREIDVSMVHVRKNEYVEVFANLALKKVSSREAQRRRELWMEISRSEGT